MILKPCLFGYSVYGSEVVVVDLVLHKSSGII